MPEDHVGQAGVIFNRQVVQRFFILQVSMVILGMRVAQGAAVYPGLAVTDMVVGVNDEISCQQLVNQVQVAAGVLAKTMDKLDDRFRLA